MRYDFYVYFVWTVPDSLKNMAFAHINEDNILSFLRSKDSKSKQRSVARSIKLFKPATFY
jgi:hypothetical protein